MAKRIKNALDFCRSSQRLFVATWLVIIFIVIIMFLTDTNDASANFTFIVYLPFLLLGLLSAIGSFACNKMLTNIHDGRKALKKSNLIHRCQSSIIIILFLLVATIITVLLFVVFLYIAQDKFGDNPIYSISNPETQQITTIEPALLIKQKIIGGAIQLVLSAAVVIVYLVLYMKIVITCDVARKDFTNLPKDIEEKINPKASVKNDTTEPLEETDDNDDEEL